MQEEDEPNPKPRKASHGHHNHHHDLQHHGKFPFKELNGDRRGSCFVHHKSNGEIGTRDPRSSRNHQRHLHGEGKMFLEGFEERRGEERDRLVWRRAAAPSVGEEYGRVGREKKLTGSTSHAQ
jgi:hypothetical protein